MTVGDVGMVGVTVGVIVLVGVTVGDVGIVGVTVGVTVLVGVGDIDTTPQSIILK